MINNVKGQYMATFRYTGDLGFYIVNSLLFDADGKNHIHLILSISASEDITLEIYSIEDFYEVCNKYQFFTIDAYYRWESEGQKYCKNLFVVRSKVPDSSDHDVFGFYTYDVFECYDKD